MSVISVVGHIQQFAPAHANGDSLRTAGLSLGETQAEVAEALRTQPIRISETEREIRKHFDVRDRYEELMGDMLKSTKRALDTA